MDVNVIQMHEHKATKITNDAYDDSYVACVRSSTAFLASESQRAGRKRRAL